MIIDLRYHIATLVAIFLALGIGILVGGSILGIDTLTAQQEQIAERLEKHLEELRGENKELREEIALLESERGLQVQFQEEILPLLVAGELANQRVAIIELNIEPAEHGLRSILETSGATVVSVTTIPGGLQLETEHRNNLQNLIWQAGAGADQDLEESIADYLAAAITAGHNEISRYLLENDLVSISGDYGQSVNSVLLVGGGGDKETPPAKQIGYPVIDHFQAQNLRVCAADYSDAEYPAINEYRTRLEATVDNADTAMGKYALIQVLSGVDGHYGVLETAERLIPAVE